MNSPETQSSTATADYPPDEINLMTRVKTVCGPYLDANAPSTSVPTAFLAALTANETGMYIWTTPDVPHRLEPSILAGLQGALNGTPYWNLTAANLAGKNLQEMASSWGLTQILGLQTIRWGCSVADLDNAASHYKWACRLLAEFAQQYGLDLTKDFEDMFTCWNAGSPAGKTTDPEYSANGVMRMGVYASLA